jgi:hypothetical protein
MCDMERLNHSVKQQIVSLGKEKIYSLMLGISNQKEIRPEEF